MRLRLRALLLLPVAWFLPAGAVVRVNPHWVNVNTTGATTVFLTFGGVSGYTPGEAVWCGEIMDATPDIGSKPVPGTIYGTLPARFNLSAPSGTGGLTDIMSVPPSVSRRAYQDAAGGARSTFFYVRHFISTTGGPDEYVPVTCELTGGGARSPFALTGVEISFDGRENLASVKQGTSPPAVSAMISYNGTGELHGRWEIFKPGDQPPAEQDLLTEAALPAEQRGRRRHYAELGRFSVFLPPTGTFTLKGPDPSKLPTEVSGLYMILLRIEESLDVEGSSDLTQAGAGDGVVQSGGVAGFPILPLRYFVGEITGRPQKGITLLAPDDGSGVRQGSSVNLSWMETGEHAIDRVVVIDSSNAILLTALLRSGVGVYNVPPWIWEKTASRHILWSIEVLDENGEVAGKSLWRIVRYQE